MTAVLIAGVPRCGSSWALKVLGRAEGATRVYEPDNETLHPQALRAKRHLGRFPVLAPGDDEPALAAIWDRALMAPAGRHPLARRWSDALWEGATPGAKRGLVEGGRSSPRLRLSLLLAAVPERRPSTHAGSVVKVAKSVHCAFSVDWLVATWDPTIVWVTRDPRNVMASWLEMDIGDRDRGLDRDPLVRAAVLEPAGAPLAPLSDNPVHRAAWHLGVYATALDRAAVRHPGWCIVRHEELCTDPHAGFRAIAERVGLVWTDACDAYIDRSDAEGEGYDVRRVASEQVDRWRKRLTSAQVQQIAEQLDEFPAASAGDVAPGRTERPR